MTITKTALIILALLTLAAAPASSLSVTENRMDDGLLLSAFALPDGGGITVAYQEAFYNTYQYFSVAYVDTSGVWQSERVNIPGNNGAPDFVVVEVCGMYVQLFANWTDGFDLENAPIYRYRWTLPFHSGLCVQNAVYLPLIGN
jgi:hypothetical protein